VLVMALAGLCGGMVMPSRDLIVREVTPPARSARCSRHHRLSHRQKP
jgi:hypothetical protein